LLLRTQTLSAQAERNRKEFAGESEEARIMYEGYRPGLYVRVVFTDVPCELVTCFDPRYPIIVGALLPNEENLGYIHVCCVVLCDRPGARGAGHC
jgi:ribosome biogenesis protein BMS1